VLPREVYKAAPEGNVSRSCTVWYADDGLTRVEYSSIGDSDDAPKDNWRRFSRDNGKTWSEPESIETVVNRQLAGGGVNLNFGAYHLDPRTRTSFQVVMPRIWPGMKLFTMDWKTGEHPFVDHVYVLEKRGGTEVKKLLRYEDGPEWDEGGMFDPRFLDANRAYFGQRIASAPDGTLYFPMVCYRHGSDYGFRKGGLVLMRRDPATGAWSASAQRYLAPEVSSRGVLEPDVAILEDGSLLIVHRGSDTPSTPGRKWMSVSTDGGKTLSPIEELRYDDGSRFYSPSSIAYFFRSRRNGRLFWAANIVPDPPRGNLPRHPLVIAEIDEHRKAVKKDGTVMVDDRRPGEPDGVQLSNFCILEDRETLDFEIYLCRPGENPQQPLRTGTYRYVFSPPG
jgi:hypothetical protein